MEHLKPFGILEEHCVRQCTSKLASEAFFAWAASLLLVSILETYGLADIIKGQGLSLGQGELG